MEEQFDNFSQVGTRTGFCDLALKVGREFGLTLAPLNTKDSMDMSGAVNWRSSDLIEGCAIFRARDSRIEKKEIHIPNHENVGRGVVANRIRTAIAELQETG